jgi:hypothetical protein
MLPRPSRLAPVVLGVFLFVCSVGIHAGNGAAQTVDISDLGQGAIPLNGLWQFHVGDNRAWAEPGFDDTNWERLRADAPWQDQGHARYSGFAWYRRRLSISAGSSSPGSLAVLMPPVDYAYELYWNGRLVGSYGKMPPHPVYLVPTLHTFGLGSPSEGVLAIRAWKPYLGSLQDNLIGADDLDTQAPVIGVTQVVAALKGEQDYRRQLKWQAVSILYVIYGLIALIGFIAWLRDRSQWFLFWMAVFLSDPCLDNILGHWNFIAQRNINWALNQPADAAGTLALWFLLLWLLGLRDLRPLMRFTKVAAATLLSISLLDAAIALFAPFTSQPGPAQAVETIATALLVPFSLYTLVPVAVALRLRRKIDHSRWIVAATTALAQTVYFLGQAGDQSQFLTGWSLSKSLNHLAFSIRGSLIFPQSVADAVVLISVVYAVYRFSMENRRRQISLEQEFQNARELQQVLIPEALPEIPGFTLTSAYRPALEVGGDFFQIISIGSGSTLVVLGDVSGKGLKAAMTVSLIVGAVHMAAETTSSPADILSALNRRLHGRLNGGFATALALRLDRSGSCVIACAGHPAPFLNAQEISLPGELPLGLDTTARYEERPLVVNAGDRLTLYTDGLLEARSANGELFSFARLKELCAEGCNATEAADTAVHFGQDDDITVLTLTRLQSDGQPDRHKSSSVLAPSAA